MRGICLIEIVKINTSVCKRNYPGTDITYTERGLEKIGISGYLLTFCESYYSTEQLLPQEEENVSFKEVQIKLDKASKRRL